MAFSLITVVKAALPLSSVLTEAGVALNRGKALCPFHTERHPSFSVKGDRFFCFGCGASGDALDFAAKFYGLDFKGALKLLADRAGIKRGKLTPSETRNFAKAVKARARKTKLINAFRLWEKGKVEELSKNLRAFNRRANLPGPLSEAALENLAALQTENDYLKYIYFEILCRQNDSEKFELFKEAYAG